MLDLNEVISNAIAEQWEKKAVLLPHVVGIPEVLTQKQVREIFAVSPGTIRKWEALGLKRYKFEKESSMVFYKISEIYDFITKIED